MMRKGSMTVYLSLTLLVLLSLIAAGLFSARLAAGRVVTASVTEQSLFSLFAQYDRDLLDTYGLLFLDGGYGGATLSPGRLLKEVEEEVELLFQPEKAGVFSLGRDPIGLQLHAAEDGITGLVLATDDHGRAFRRQICEITQQQLGPAGLLFLQNTLQKQEEAIAAQQEAFEAYEIDRDADLPVVPQENAEDTAEEAATPTWFFNPFEVLRGLRAAGVLALTVPQAVQISSAEIDGDTLVSGRRLSQGMNMPADGWEGGGEKFLLLQYLTEQFSCYTTCSAGATDGLRYQIEYAIAGKTSDRENLQEVLLQLLHMREAANFLHLLRTPQMRAEADGLAELISLLVLNPELQPAIAMAILFAWAYGESIMDLQELLNGGKIPLLKDAASWQLPLAEVPFLRLRPVSSGDHNAKGLDYAEYLRLLLFLENADDLTISLMDLTELQIRTIGGRPNFRLDTCVDALRVELHVAAGRKEFQIERGYGYNA